MKEAEVSVIIPSYNRAHLLPLTIPSYFQDHVLEVILVDDCSTDNTPHVVQELQQKFPQLIYVRQPKNSRQAAAKNKGISMAKGRYFYFGDDDSFVIPGTIDALLNTLQTMRVDMVAAKAIYMESDENQSDWEQIVKRRSKIGNPVKSYNKLTFDFTLSVEKPTEVKVAQACLLVKAALAKSTLFDADLYVGSGFREETDFIVQAIGQGAKLIYNSDAVQINLPRHQTTGGSRDTNRWTYETTTLANNSRFIDKNYTILKKYYGVTWPSWLMKIHFVYQRKVYLMMAAVQTLFPRFYMRLKKIKATFKQ